MQFGNGNFLIFASSNCFSDENWHLSQINCLISIINCTKMDFGISFRSLLQEFILKIKWFPNKRDWLLWFFFKTLNVVTILYRQTRPNCLNSTDFRLYKVKYWNYKPHFKRWYISLQQVTFAKWSFIMRRKDNLMFGMKDFKAVDMFLVARPVPH